MKTQEQSVKPIGRPAILALNCLIPSGSNREVKKDTDLKGLASSIAEVGLIYPIVVKPDSEHDGQFRIIVKGGAKVYQAAERKCTTWM